LVEASERADWDANLQFTAARILEELGYEEEAAAADQRLQALLDEWQEQQASSGRIQFSEEDWRLPAAEADGDGAGGDGEGAGSAPAGAAGADGATGGAGSDRGDGAAGGEAGDGAADGGQPGSPGAGGANP